MPRSIHTSVICLPMKKHLRHLASQCIFDCKLQTADHGNPYGWTIYLDDAFTKKQQTTVEKTMKNYAMVILACTKNLGSVTFSYTLDGKTTDFTYTKEQGENEFLGTCNYFRSSATEFQTLLAKPAS